jgi:hypothetical protein
MISSLCSGGGYNGGREMVTNSSDSDDGVRHGGCDGGGGWHGGGSYGDVRGMHVIGDGDDDGGDTERIRWWKNTMVVVVLAIMIAVEGVATGVAWWQL